MILSVGGAYADHEKRCPPLAAATETLAKDYGETPVAHGLATNGQLLVIFAAKDGSTWTAVVINPATSEACQIGAGEAWESISPPAGPDT